MKRSTKLLTRVQGPSQPGPAGAGKVRTESTGSILTSAGPVRGLRPSLGHRTFEPASQDPATPRGPCQDSPGAWPRPSRGCGRHRPANPARWRKNHVHDLRHTGNTLAGEAGASLRELMDRVGPSSTHAALIYQHRTSLRDKDDR